MKINFILFLILFLGVSSCRMTNETFQQPLYGNHCENSVLVESVYSQHYMNIAEILKYAKEKHGNDVSISNIHYDVKNSQFFFWSKRKSCIFDIVKCNK